MYSHSMHLDRTELQLLLVAARGEAFAARSDAERAPSPWHRSEFGRRAEALERLAAKLEGELVKAVAETPSPAAPN
jgi:hypothetical protein